jgi:starch phosphorylase
MHDSVLNRPLPKGLEGLAELAIDLRWSGSQQTDRLWEMLDPEAWERTTNPYMILQNVSQDRLEEAANNKELKAELAYWLKKRKQKLTEKSWFERNYGSSGLKKIAYFSMEFGLSEALPIYSGGLGILAGDHLKTASDLGIPMVGIGLLYQQGYFRQTLSMEGWQIEAFPYNDPTCLPVAPVQNQNGGWLRVKLQLPGRTLLLRVWEARVGRVPLYLLDSNDPLNSPWDRGITANLYSIGQERRLLQEIALGSGGWRVVEALGLDVDVCHMNEGHAAFVVLARALSFMRKHNVTFAEALQATRAGNVFTTHTPVAAGFDRFPTDLIRRFADPVAEAVGISTEELLALGRRNAHDYNEPVNMAYLAMHGSGYVNAVSKLHGQVSKRIFCPLFPGWPVAEVPVDAVTNGIHIPTWDSQAASSLWSQACGEDYWLEASEHHCRQLEEIPDDKLWDYRATARQSLVNYVRRRLVRQVQQQGASVELIQRARHVLDLNALTLGFARRFAEYKRPTLLLRDLERLARLLSNQDRPVQLIVAGKAHPADEESKKMVQAVAQFARRDDMFDRVVFLADYDMTLAQHLVAGVDVWLNNPRRPWEASGTSGMKVLVNGGLNFSELDGWWDEAYSPEVGWSLGDGQEHDPSWDVCEAEMLYRTLEEQIVPEFYDRDEQGIPRSWLHRIRASMMQLTPQFSSNRMMREYVQRAYLPASEAYQKREANNGEIARQLVQWKRKLVERWKGLRISDLRVTTEEGMWHFEAHVYLGELSPDDVQVQLFSEPEGEGHAFPAIMERKAPISGAVNGHLYAATVPANRPLDHYTPRIVPFHPDMIVPLEEMHIYWQH